MCLIVCLIGFTFCSQFFSTKKKEFSLLIKFEHFVFGLYYGLAGVVCFSFSFFLFLSLSRFSFFLFLSLSRFSFFLFLSLSRFSFFLFLSLSRFSFFLFLSLSHFPFFLFLSLSRFSFFLFLSLSRFSFFLFLSLSRFSFFLFLALSRFSFFLFLSLSRFSFFLFLSLFRFFWLTVCCNSMQPRPRQCVTFFCSFFFRKRERCSGWDAHFTVCCLDRDIVHNQLVFSPPRLFARTCVCVCLWLSCAGFVFFTRFVKIFACSVSFSKKFSFHKHSCWLSFQQESSSSSRKLFYIVQVYNKTTSNN